MEIETMILAIIVSFGAGFYLGSWWMESLAMDAAKETIQDHVWKSTYKERMEALDKIDQIDRYYDRKEAQQIKEIMEKKK